MWNLFNLNIDKTKFPNHILLDWQSAYSHTSSQYWFLKHIIISDLTNNYNFLLNFVLIKKINTKKSSFAFNKLLRNARKFTVKYSKAGVDFNAFTSFSSFKNFFAVNLVKSKTAKNTFTSSYEKEMYQNINLPDKKIIKNNLNKFLKNFSWKNNLSTFENNNLWSLFDIHFLKKEKMYTKLKYSRVPQYDIVSGGVAALFAGFLGFLICEKFGFELLDSGDFYILFMYIVFISFFLRLFSNIFTHNQQSWSGFSLKWFFLFYKNLIFLFFKKLRFLINIFR